MNKLNGKVDTTRTINGKALSEDITITKEEIGLTNVDNVKQYSADNPPPYPVISINGQTGAVSITLANLGAAAAEHEHSAEDITSGTLAITRSGTGRTDGAAPKVLIGSTVYTMRTGTAGAAGYITFVT